MPAPQTNTNSPQQAQHLIGSEHVVSADEDVAWLDRSVAPLVRQILDASVALDERLRLQAVACDRLDELFALPRSKRGGSAELRALPSDARGTTVEQWSTSAALRAHALTVALHENWQQKIQPQLVQAKGIRLSHVAELTPDQQSGVRADVVNRIWPLLTPLAVDQGHPFPVLPDRQLNLAVLCKDCQCVVCGDGIFAIVAVPSVFGRTLEVTPSTDGPKTFVLLEEAIAVNLDVVFPESRISACCPFRITRRRACEAGGARYPRSSRAASRLEIGEATAEVESPLRSHLGLEDWDICRVPWPIRLGDLSMLCRVSLQ